MQIKKLTIIFSIIIFNSICPTKKEWTNSGEVNSKEQAISKNIKIKTEIWNNAFGPLKGSPCSLKSTIYIDNEYAGMCHVGSFWWFEKEPSAQISGIKIKESFQCNGYGKLLLQHTLSELKDLKTKSEIAKKQLSSVKLLAQPESGNLPRLLRFYNNEGFEIDGYKNECLAFMKREFK